MGKPIRIEKHVAAPPDRVFAAAADVRNYGDVVRGIKKVEVLTDGPIGVGTRFRETRVMFNREATEEMEFVRYEPPRSYALEAASHGCRYFTSFEFEPEGPNDTKVAMEFRAEPQTFVAKVLGAVMAPMMKRMIVKCVGDDLDDLKAHVEGRGAPQP